jgi:hypothetical protein
MRWQKEIKSKEERMKGKHGSSLACFHFKNHILSCKKTELVFDVFFVIDMSCSDFKVLFFSFT